MKILVCLNQVPDTTARLGATASAEIDYAGAAFILNPIDEKALTKAVMLKEKLGATLTLVNVGQNSESMLRKAFAVGADKMIRIDTPPTNSLQVAKEIARIAQNFDLVLCGNESIDYHGGMVGGLVAGLLQMNYVSNATAINIEGATAELECESNTGRSTLVAELPLVVSVHKEIVSEVEIRLPNMRNIMAARTAPIEVLAASVEPSSVVTKVEKPAERTAAKMFSPSEIDLLIEELHSVKKVL